MSRLALFRSLFTNLVLGVSWVNICILLLYSKVQNYVMMISYLGWPLFRLPQPRWVRPPGRASHKRWPRIHWAEYNHHKVLASQNRGSRPSRPPHDPPWSWWLCTSLDSNLRRSKSGKRNIWKHLIEEGESVDWNFISLSNLRFKITLKVTRRGRGQG